MSTCRTLPASPDSARGSCGSCSNVSSRPLFSVSSLNIHCTSCSSACRSNGSTAQRRAARLDLRHLQDVVDQRQQVIAAGVDDVDLLLLIVAQVAVAFEQLRVAEDRVHRRADLVRHVGQEGALGPAGALRGFLGGAQLGRAAGHERFEVLLVLAQLEIGDEHLGERVEQGPFLEEERALRRTKGAPRGTPPR